MNIKKIFAIVVILIMSLSLIACGNTNTEETEKTESIGLDNIDKVEVDERIFDVTLSIPADFVDSEKNQADYDAMAKEMGYKSITLNEDGSLTYVLTKSQHKKMMTELKNSLQESLDEMCSSEEYPNFVSIKVNDNFSEFTIVTKSEELDFGESFSILGFYICAGMYNVFNGTEVDNVHIKFINEATGNIIDEANSADMAEQK